MWHTTDSFLEALDNLVSLEKHCKEFHKDIYTETDAAIAEGMVSKIRRELKDGTLSLPKAVKVLEAYKTKLNIRIGVYCSITYTLENLIYSLTSK